MCENSHHTPPSHGQTGPRSETAQAMEAPVRRTSAQCTMRGQNNCAHSRRLTEGYRASTRHTTVGPACPPGVSTDHISSMAGHTFVGGLCQCRSQRVEAVSRGEATRSPVRRSRRNPAEGSASSNPSDACNRRALRPVGRSRPRRGDRKRQRWRRPC